MPLGAQKRHFFSGESEVSQSIMEKYIYFFILSIKKEISVDDKFHSISPHDWTCNEAVSRIYST